MEDKNVKLSEMPTGSHCVIVRLSGHGGFRHSLMELGFVRGEKVRVVKNKVKAMVCIGTESATLKKAFQRDVKDIYQASSLEEAVTTASLLAQENDIVLFSPACKSDIDGESYIERGDLFIKTVKKLEK